MIPRAIQRLVVLALVLATGAIATFGQTSKSKKVFMITDMEGVSGIFDSDLQCLPYKSPRWEESHKLLTGEVNAAVDGLLAGGATDVVVLGRPRLRPVTLRPGYSPQGAAPGRQADFAHARTRLLPIAP